MAGALAEIIRGKHYLGTRFDFERLLSWIAAVRPYDSEVLRVCVHKGAMHAVALDAHSQSRVPHFESNGNRGQSRTLYLYQ